MVSVKISTRIKNILSVILLILILFMSLTLVFASSYTVLSFDDYSHGAELGVFGADIWTYLKACFHYTYLLYIGWQGTYFAMFLQNILSPINGFGMPQLRVVMIVNSVLFLVSFTFFIKSLIKKLDYEIWEGLLLIFLIFFALMGYEVNAEGFMWYSGAVSYTFPLSMLFIALGIVFRKDIKGKKIATLLACILGFLAAGGALVVSGIACYIMLLICLYDVLSNAHSKRRNRIIFIVWLIGACINTVAPGNYERNTIKNGSGLNLVAAIRNTFKAVDTRANWLFSETNFIVLVVIFILLGVVFVKRNSIELSPYAVTSIWALLLPFVAAFPAVLGYNSADLSARCYCVVDLTMELVILNFAFVSGMVLSEHITSEHLELFKTYLVVGIFILAIQNYTSIFAFKPIELFEEIATGTYSKYYQSAVEIHDMLVNADENEDVLILMSDIPADIPNLRNLYITDDTENWVNASMAICYHVKSIAIESIETDYGEE